MGPGLIYPCQGSLTLALVRPTPNQACPDVTMPMTTSDAGVRMLIGAGRDE